MAGFIWVVVVDKIVLKLFNILVFWSPCFSVQGLKVEGGRTISVSVSLNSQYILSLNLVI